MKNTPIGSRPASQLPQHQKHNYFIKQLKSFRYAFRGIRLAFSDYNFLIHAPAGLLVFAMGFYFEIKVTEWLFLLSAVFGVWILETVNLAIEKLCDKVQPDYDVLIEKIKDLAAGAVLMASIYAVLVGLIVFIPYVQIF